MNARAVRRVAAVALAQVVLLGLAMAPRLSAHAVGEEYRLRVAAYDPIDPFRGAYVSLDYPGLQHEPDYTNDEQRGDLYVTLRREGDVWVAGTWTRRRPEGTPYLSCDDRSWEVRCGIESWFLPQDEADSMARTLAAGAVAEVRVDDRGNAAVVDVREAP
jgi:uncharacterized membrane-anchored protein